MEKGMIEYALEGTNLIVTSILIVRILLLERKVEAIEVRCKTVSNFINTRINGIKKKSNLYLGKD